MENYEIPPRKSLHRITARKFGILNEPGWPLMSQVSADDLEREKLLKRIDELERQVAAHRRTEQRLQARDAATSVLLGIFVVRRGGSSTVTGNRRSTRVAAGCTLESRRALERIKMRGDLAGTIRSSKPV